MHLSEFLFGPYPIAFHTSDTVFFYAAIVATGLGILVGIVKFFGRFNSVNQKLLARFRNLFVTFGLIGLLWSAIRYQNPLYLSWRFWFVLLSLVCLVWGLFILWYMIRHYRKDLGSYRKEEIKQKYLK